MNGSVDEPIRTSVGVVRRVAVLLTVHNRRMATIACLKSICAQVEIAGVDLVVFVVDDGSTDGTEEAVRRMAGNIRLLRGNGSLYWGGGMRLAFAAASKEFFDFFWWLNDDLVLFPIALKSLLDTYSRVLALGGSAAVIVGALRDPGTGEVTYGGWKSSDSGPRLRMKKIAPGSSSIRCDAMNGNCVLIPRVIANALGNIDEAFPHAMGDLDYGFRARARGYSLWLAPGFIGTADKNSGDDLWSDTGLALGARWKRMLGPKGLPLEAWRIFTRRHCGQFWLWFWLKPYLVFWIREPLLTLFQRRRSRDK